MKLKELQGILGELNSFKNPKVNLEQYQTGPEIAGIFLYQTAHLTYNDISERIVADFGCGCGTFVIGCSLLGARWCFGFDIDDSALDISYQNANELHINNIDLIRYDVTSILRNRRESGTTPIKKVFDTVIMNPPFGTKNNEGIDIKFLQAGLLLSQSVVYSFHKTSTRKFLSKKLQSWNFKGEPLHQVVFDLPSTYKFHKQSTKDIEVDLWRIQTSA